MSQHTVKPRPQGLRRRAYLAAGVAGLVVACILYIILPHEPTWHAPAERGIELIGFSSDGRRLYTAEDRWKLGVIHTRESTGSIKTLGMISEPPFTTFDFWKLSADGYLLAHAGRLDGQRLLRLYETATGKLLHQQPLSDCCVMVEFAPNRQSLVFANEASEQEPGRVEMMEISNGKITRTLSGITGKHLAVRYSMDGASLLISTVQGMEPTELASTATFSKQSPTLLQVFDIQTGTERRRLDNVFAPAVQQDGRMIVFRHDAGTQQLVWQQYALSDATGAPEAEMAIRWDKPLHPQAAQCWWPEYTGNTVVLNSWGYDKATTWQKWCSTWRAEWWLALCRYFNWGPTEGLVAVQQMQTFDAATGKPRHQVYLTTAELGSSGVVAPGGRALAFVPAGQRLEYWEAPIGPSWILIMGIAGLVAAMVLVILRVRRWRIRRQEARLATMAVEPMDVIYRRRSIPPY